jgi:GDP-L-fucose synthase
MEKSGRIFIAGHNGLAGSAIASRLFDVGYENLILRTRDELDLTESSKVDRFFREERPDTVILAAAKVGGILANSRFPVQFLEINLAIQQNVISAAAACGVNRLLFLGSSCIYPRNCDQPIKEEYLLTAALEPTNRAYALAKIAGIELCNSYNFQYGTQFVSLMPTNLYGVGDNYSSEGSHVIPGLIRRIHEAKEQGMDEVTIWGTGRPQREFLFSGDLADACLFVLSNIGLILEHLKKDNKIPIINVGSSEELTIEETAKEISRVIGFEGKLVFDRTKPDGTPRKILDTKILSSFGWAATTRLKSGLPVVYQDFLERRASGEWQ